MSESPDITILGAGPAGLAVGYYAKKNGLPFKLYEADNRIGGNSTTFRAGRFFFDSGAHRFHDKCPEVTKEIKELLGEDLIKICIPSHIYHKGRFIDFPLSPLNLMINLGLYDCFKAGFQLLIGRLKKRGVSQDFESFALATYGRTIAKYFLLDYSRKLWGKPCCQLSPNIAGKRMKGLSFKSFLLEAIFGKKLKTEHLDGSFYYPKMGIGIIAQKLAEACNEKNIIKNAKITKILHSHNQIQAIEVNGIDIIQTDEIVSSLPLKPFLQMMEPKPPQEILELAESLSFRNIILVVILLNKESVTKSATVYFPDSQFPFTRIYEPKNRSKYMSGQGKTSLVVEIPCEEKGALWDSADNVLTRQVSSHLTEIGWIKEEEIIGVLVKRLPHAYPRLEMGFEKKLKKIYAYFQHFNNLKFSGRGGRFIYAHIHDMMKFGKDIITEYISQEGKEILKTTAESI